MKNIFCTLVLGLLSLSFLSAGAAFGEPEAPAPAPLPTALPTARAVVTAQPSYIGMMEIKADVAEHDYQNDPKPANLSEYINNEQELLAATCLRELVETLQYPGYPEAQSCRDAIKKILDIDSANPIAQCAQSGIDSAQCREASARVKIGWYNVNSRGWTLDDRSRSGFIAQIDLQTELQEKSSHQQVTDSEHDLHDAWENVHIHPHDRTFVDAYETKLQHVLKLTCVNTKLALDPPATPTPAPTVPGSKGSLAQKTPTPEKEDPFSRVLDSIDKTARPVATPTPVIFNGPMYNHYRLLPAACLREVQAGATLIPNSPVVVCYRDGATSPSCIDARRHAGARPKPQQKSTHIDGAAMSDF